MAGGMRGCNFRLGDWSMWREPGTEGSMAYLQKCKEASCLDQRREQVTQVRKKKRQGMYRSLNLDPRAKRSYFNLNHDLIKFKSTCLLQYEEKLLPDKNMVNSNGTEFLPYSATLLSFVVPAFQSLSWSLVLQTSQLKFVPNFDF